MSTSLRQTGIGIVGEMPWGTHFCHFYETRDDLLDTLVAYFKAGLESDESCVWVVSEPLTEDEAWTALRAAVPGLDRYVSEERIEIVGARDWYLDDGTFDMDRVAAGWDAKLEAALRRGSAGLRVSGNTAWLEPRDWRAFCEYERRINRDVSGRALAVLCTYPLLTSGATEALDVVRTHQFTIARRRGHWEVVDPPPLVAGAEITRLNAALIEGRKADDALRRAQSELASVTQLTTIAELAAALAHELNQPLSAVVSDASACVRWLSRESPNLAEAIAAVERIVRDANRASDMIARTRALLRKATPEKTRLDLSDVVREVLALLRPETEQRRVVIHATLPDDLPAVLGDRTHLQQVVLNLVTNAIEAMTGVSESSRDLTVTVRPHDAGGRPGVLVAVRDAGVGIKREHLERIFDAFYTTKAHGLGMGLTISRSIVQEHGGRLWATSGPEPGSTVQFILPTRPA